MVQTESCQVQPCSVRIPAICALVSPPSVVPAVITIVRIGSTSSFAGLPKRNASKIAPFSPITLAGISTAEASHCKSVSSPTDKFASATATALPNTKTVRSRKERTSTCPTRGRR